MTIQAPKAAAAAAAAAAVAPVEAAGDGGGDADGTGDGGAAMAGPALRVRARDPGLVTTIRPPFASQAVRFGERQMMAPSGSALGTAGRGFGMPLALLSSAEVTRRLPVLVPAVLVALALLFSVPRLTTPNTYVFDELYYAYTAGKYVAGEEAYDTAVMPRDDPAIEWTHPPLAKLLISGGILLAGDNPLGWRIASVLAGVAGVLIAYFLALELTGSRVTSAVAAGLLLLDGLYLVESRTGMSNLFLLVFANGALLALARVLTVAPERVGPPLLAAGLFLGLAIATKWSAVALLGLIGLVILWQIARLWRESRRADENAPQAWAGLRAYLFWAPITLLAVPVAIYVASYVHFFLTGHSWGDVVQLHRDMLAYHRGLGVVHDDSSPWWQWPLAARGVWYYANERRDEIRLVFGNGNPLLYWPMVVAVLWVAIDWWGRRSAALVILLIGFFGQWLPWALSPRGTFVYHFLPSVPLGCLALAVVLTGAWRRGGMSRGVAAVYAAAVIATFVFFYPISTAMPLDAELVNLRMWLPSWR